MSRMADLEIDIITELSTHSKEFAAAIDCACSNCQAYTLDEINREFKNMDLGAWVKANPLRVVKAQS